MQQASRQAAGNRRSTHPHLLTSRLLNSPRTCACCWIAAPLEPCTCERVSGEPVSTATHARPPLEHRRWTRSARSCHHPTSRLADHCHMSSSAHHREVVDTSPLQRRSTIALAPRAPLDVHAHICGRCQQVSCHGRHTYSLRHAAVEPLQRPNLPQRQPNGAAYCPPRRIP